MKLFDFLPEGLIKFLEQFEDDLSRPQFENLKIWTSGIIEGKSSIYEIQEEFSEKHISTLTRFMNESNWNHKKLNKKRISWALNILKLRHQKYYPIIIDDTVNKKYGKLISRTGRFYSNSEKRVVNGQSIVTSHLYVSNSDIPLFVDIYKKKDEYTDVNDFKSKIDFAMQHIKMAPHLESRCGVVITDSWYSSIDIIKTTLLQSFEGIFALKKNRMLKYLGVKQQVSAIAVSQATNFENITVEGTEYRIWTSKVTLSGITNNKIINRNKLRLFISQQKLTNDNWSGYAYLLATDMSMDKWTILHLYKKRWKIETFYKFAKNAFDFRGSQLRSYDGAIRYFTLLFFAYTYLTLTRFPHFINMNNTKSQYSSLKMLENEKVSNMVSWIYQETKNGANLDDIKLKLGI